MDSASTRNLQITGGVQMISFRSFHIILQYTLIVCLNSPYPRTEEIELQIFTTAKISDNFSRGASYISNTFVREAPNFPYSFLVRIKIAWEMNLFIKIKT